MYKIFIAALFNTCLFGMHGPCKKIKNAPLVEQVLYHQENVSHLTARSLYAASQGDSQTIKALLPHVDLNTENEQGESALTKAVHRNHQHIVELLLGTNQINPTSRGSIRALLWAAQNGNSFLVCKLVKAGTSINSKDPSTGYTALMMAVYKNNIVMVNLLLSNQAIDITVRNDDDDTAWSLACKLEYWALARTIFANSKNA